MRPTSEVRRICRSLLCLLAAGGTPPALAQPAFAQPAVAQPAVAQPPVAQPATQVGASATRAPRIVLRSIRFAPDSARLDAASHVTLELAAQWMSEHPEARLQIVGHCSTPGTEAYNAELSLRRASQVKQVLVDRGVAADRLEAVGRGEFEPIASDATAEGRALNRRVEFVVVEGGEAVRTVSETAGP